MFQWNEWKRLFSTVGLNGINATLLWPFLNLVQPLVFPLLRSSLTQTGMNASPERSLQPCCVLLWACQTSTWPSFSRRSMLMLLVSSPLVSTGSEFNLCPHFSNIFTQILFFRWISSLRHHPPWVRQTLHHIPGAAEVPGHPGGQSRRAGINRSAQFEGKPGRQHLWQKRRLTQWGRRKICRTLERNILRCHLSPDDFESSHILCDVFAFLWCWFLLLLPCFCFRF